MELSLYLKPSRLGQYYELLCDKYLVYYSVSTEDYEKLGWTKPEKQQTNASIEAGNEWEKILYDRLKDDDACETKQITYFEKDKDKEKKPDIDKEYEQDENIVDVLKNLSTKDKPIYLYQACLSVTPSFENTYLSDVKGKTTKVSMSNRMLPDFIKAEYSPKNKKYRLTVIDAKNAGFLKVSAEVQITIYVKVLKYLLKDEKITNCFVNEEEGIVWNREKITDNLIENVFQLKEAEETIESFFHDKLPKLCDVMENCKDGEELQKALEYSISQKCEYCDNFETCKDFCASNSSVRLMPYMTQNAQERIKELLSNGTLQDDSVEQLKEVLENEPQLLTDDCAYWKNVKNNLDAYTQGISDYYSRKKMRYQKNASSIAFPVYQDFSLFLTAQQDVSSGRVYAYSWFLSPAKGLDIWDLGLNQNGYVAINASNGAAGGEGTYFDTLIALEKTTDEFDRIDQIFVEKIYELLKRISEYPEPKKRRLQCYVMDEYERKNIENMLFHILETVDFDEGKELIEKVTAILFWLQGDRLVTDSDEEPEKCVENPMTVISSEISRLYVLSEGVSYNLKGIASVFSPKFNFDNDNWADNFFGTLSNVVNDKTITDIWKDRKKDDKRIEILKSHLRKRLFVEKVIIATVQSDNFETTRLSTWPAQFTLLKPKYPDYPEVAKLDFENRYEQLLSYHAIRKLRVAGVQNAIDNGDILWLEYTGNENTYKILNNESYIGREWFSAWLCEDTPENRLQIMILRDTDYTVNKRIRNMDKFTPYGETMSFYPAAFGNKYNFNDDGESATVDFLSRKNSGFFPRKGQRYLFFEVFSDMNGEKTEYGISRLLDATKLLSPKDLSGDTGVKYTKLVSKTCSEFWSPDGNKFSDSQEKAFKHLIEQKLTVLVGPPASGKTDFIARAIITLTSFYKKTSGRNMKVMISAMSHSAIENVLLKMDKMLRNSNPCNIQLLKADRFDDATAFVGTSVRLIGAKEKEVLFDQGISIIGMTCYSAYKFFLDPKWGEMLPFDMIVIDEASQLRAMDSFLALECSKEDTRFLLVGDDDQLPPIIAGKYKEKVGQKYIHGSVFKMFLSDLGEDHPDIVQLNDNFRMNSILCRYPAIALYGDEYKAFNKEIATRRIALSYKSRENIVASILDPDYPLVFLELFGSTREQNSVEVNLVTILVGELWNSLMNPDTQRLACEDGNFWRDCNCSDGKRRDGAFGIISPHHEHINRLRSSISDVLGMSRNDIFIGTVDKLQGKERQAVVVSYGVSDSEKAINEGEFIFSSNRFNVSMTRGKAKTIIILSDAIAESSMKTNALIANDESLKKGVRFIHGFVQYMRSKEPGEDMVFEDYPYELGDVSLKLWKKKAN